MTPLALYRRFRRRTGGKFEKKAKKIFQETRQVPVTTAHDMFDEVDVLKRGAGTLLNARLIPLIAEFHGGEKRHERTESSDTDRYSTKRRQLLFGGADERMSGRDTAQARQRAWSVEARWHGKKTQ